MRIAVVGGTGRTGREVVQQALARGHSVTAVARKPDAISASDPHLTVARADVLESDNLIHATRDCDALISTLGIGSSRAPTEVYSRGVAHELKAMAVNGIQKLAVISAAPVGAREGQPLLQRRVVMPLLEVIFGSTYADMRRMESILRASDVDWLALRPPRLLDKPGTGAYRIDRDPIPKARTLTYSDLAAALLDTLARDDLTQTAAYIAN